MDSLCGNLTLRLDTWIQDTWKHLISNTKKGFSVKHLNIETRYKWQLNLTLDTWIQDTWKHLISNT